MGLRFAMSAGKLYRFTVQITVRGPVLTKSAAPSSFGLDAAVARVFAGPGKGRPCLPASHMRGKIREAMEELFTPECANELLGERSREGTDEEPRRGCLVFEDLVHEGDFEEAAGRRNRIALVPETGSVVEGALQVMEEPFASGERAEFRGSAWYFGSESEDAHAKLAAALRFLTHVGSNRSTGFGRVLAAEVDGGADSGTAAGMPWQPGKSALAVTLHPMMPLCITRHKIGGNLFESDDVLPGNMLAGAVMQTAKSLGLKIPHFDRIRFRHGFPSTGEERASVIPLSTVKAGDRHYDVSACPEPVLIRVADEWRSPEFQTDWKDDGLAREKHHWARAMRELRVRTEIDSSKRTANRGGEGADGGSLFAWEVVHPWDEENKPVAWRARIDLADVPEEDREEVAQVLGTVLARLGFVSKTKALCACGAAAVDAPSLAVLGETLRLVLQTPALLADPRFQKARVATGKVWLDAAETLALYQEAWAELSAGTLELTHCFADQFLAGGKHLAVRFQKRRPYNPWLLTSAGSVFVFAVKDKDRALARVNEWLAQGLPLPNWAATAFGSDWKSNPYLPQNGFGEISVSPALFPAPEKDEMRRVTLVVPEISPVAPQP